MVDVFRLLKPMSWRGIQYPVSERNVSFLHENVDHKIQYRSNDFPEPIGPHSFLFKYTIPMREGIAKGKYVNLFNEGLPILVAAMREKEPGDLYDTVYGEYRCIPVSFSETTDVNKRDGTDVQVEFLHAPRIGESDPKLPTSITGIVGLVSDSGMLDDDLAKLDWNQEPSPEGVTDILSAINGIGRQGLRQVDKLASQLDALSFKLQKIEETADASENPQNWRIRDSARQLQLDVLTAKNRAIEDPGVKIKRVTVKAYTTVSALAAESGMTVAELLVLNPGLARSPRVPAGFKINTKIKVDKSSSS